MHNTRRPARRLLVTAILLLSGPRFAASAGAFWAAPGGGSASVSVASLMPPTGASASATDGTGTVKVTWRSSTAPGAGAVDGFFVQRLSNGTPSPACGTSASTLVAGSSCDDPGVADGSYTYMVTAVFRTWTAQSAASTPITVANLDHLAVEAPATAGAGAPFDLTVTARAASGATITGYVGTVHLSSSDPQATLPADHTYGQGDKGSHLFSGSTTLRTSGSQSVTATDTTKLSTTGTAAVHVAAAPATMLRFSQQPTSTTAGATMAPAVTLRIEDSYGNLSSTPTTVRLAVTGGAAALSGTTTQVSTTGVATFADVSTTAAGTYTLTATSNGLTASTSASFTIRAAAASKLCIVATLPTCTGGTLSVARASTTTTQVRIFDQHGNVATATTAVSITLATLGEVGAPVPARATIGIGASTSGSFSVTINSGAARAGTVTASAAGLTAGSVILRST